MLKLKNFYKEVKQETKIMKNKELIYGIHASLAAILNKNRKITKMLCTKETFLKIKEKLKDFKIPKYEIVDRKFIDNKLQNKFHQGIVIECEKLEKKQYDEILENYESDILILDSLNDSQNVGAIIRSAYLFGIELIFYNENNSFNINPTLIKSASGAYEKVSLIKVVNINKLILKLKKLGYWIIGLDSSSELSIEKIPSEIKKVLILGSESKGIRKLIKTNCDYLTKIPMQKSDQQVDSLNVSNAASIIFYEISKKKK